MGNCYLATPAALALFFEGTVPTEQLPASPV